VHRLALAPPRSDWATLIPAFIALLAAGVLVGIPWPQNLFLVASGTAFVIAALNPPAGLAVLVASIPLQAVGEEQLGPIHLTVTKVILMATLAAWAGRTLVERRSIRVDRTAISHLAYVAVLALTIVNTSDRGSWGAELYRWWTPLVVYLIAINSITSVAEAKPVIWGTAAGTIGTSIVGFVQVVGGYGPESFDVNGFTRAFATFGQPNPFAGYLDVGVPILIAVAAGAILPARLGVPALPLGPLLTTFVTVAAVCGLVSMILTQSRGGWLGITAGLLCVAWMLGNVVRWTVVGAGVALLAVVVMTPPGQQLGGRLAHSFSLRSENVLVTPENFAVQERLAHWRAGIAMAEKYPVLGVGAGNFSNRYRDFTEIWRFRISRGHAHNAYIHAAAQSGFVGLTSYLLFLGVAGSQLARALRASHRRPERPLVIGAIGVTVAFAVHNMFDYLHVLSLPLQLSVVWALAQLALRPTSGEPDRTTTPPSAARSTWHRPGQMVVGSR
jgi:O-antigen ligase